MHSQRQSIPAVMSGLTVFSMVLVLNGIDDGGISRATG